MAMLWLDWWLTLAVLALLGGAMGWLTISACRSSDRAKDYGRAREEVNAAIIEFMQAMPTVRTFDGGHASVGRYQQALDQFSAFVARWYREVAGSGNLLMVLLNPLAPLVLVLALGLWLNAAGMTEAGTLLAFLLVSAALSEAVMPLLFLQSTTQKIASPVRRIWQLLDLAEPAHGTAVQELPNHEIRFENISFCYEAGEKNRQALKNLSFTAPSGQVTALVGPSGAGKTTVARLIPCFWEPDAGRILIGSTDIRDLTEEQLLRLVGFVFQDTFLFSGTIADNIRFGSAARIWRSRICGHCSSPDCRSGCIIFRMC